MADRLYATFDPATHGADLDLDQANTVVVLAAATTLNQFARILYGKSSGQQNVETMVWGDGSLTNNAALGFVNAAADGTSEYVGGTVNGYGYRPAEGAIYNNDASIASVTAAVKGDIIELILTFDPTTGAGSATWKLNNAVLYTQALAAGEWWAAVSIAGAAAGDLSCFMNAGQRSPEYAETVGWYTTGADVPTIRVADDDYMTAHDDDLPDTPFDGVIIGDQSFGAVRELTFWVEGNASTATAACTFSIQNQTGAMNAAYSRGLRGKTVRIQSIDDETVAYSTAADVGTFVIDKIDTPDENTIRYVLKDSILDLELPLQQRLILPNAEASAANQPWPIVLGSARSLTPVLLDALTLTYAFADTGVVGFGYVRDKGDPLDPNATPTPDYTIASNRQTITLANQPQGKVTADASSVGGGADPTSADDIWAGAANPFTGTVGVAPDGFTDYEASTGFGYPCTLAASGQLHMSHGFSAVKLTAGATLLAGRSYRFNITVDSVVDGDFAAATYMGIGIAATPDRYSYNAGLVSGSGISGVPGTYSQIITNTTGADITDPWLYMNVAQAGRSGEAYVSGVELLLIPDTYAPAALIPIKLADFFDEIMRRSGRSASQYSRADAAAIDTATGYAGMGFFTSEPITRRAALDMAAASYTACFWQDKSNILRVTQLRAPEGETSTFTLTEDDYETDMKRSDYLMPALTTQWGYAPNWTVLNDSDFVTDFIDVPAATRRVLSRKYQGVVGSAVALSSSYAASVFSQVHGSLLDQRADAQAEDDRVCQYASIDRYEYDVDLPRGTVELGQYGTIYHADKYGLAAGKAVMVKRIFERFDEPIDTVTFLG
jgi:hypothetical protein